MIRAWGVSAILQGICSAHFRGLKGKGTGCWPPLGVMMLYGNGFSTLAVMRTLQPLLQPMWPLLRLAADDSGMIYLSSVNGLLFSAGLH